LKYVFFLYLSAFAHRIAFACSGHRRTSPDHLPEERQSGVPAARLDRRFIRFPRTHPPTSRLFRRRPRNFNLPLAPQGTPFQQEVWKELCKIPYGETISYGELAKRIGNSKASRAVGLANGSNPIPIIIPCHRVIGSNGKLTGYGGGLPIKEKLLALERRQLRLL
jgi:methylated-DNA-[protein]-cysteine S-methyltransferase